MLKFLNSLTWIDSWGAGASRAACSPNVAPPQAHYALKFWTFNEDEFFLYYSTSDLKASILLKKKTYLFWTYICDFDYLMHVYICLHILSNKQDLLSFFSFPFFQSVLRGLPKLSTGIHLPADPHPLLDYWQLPLYSADTPKRTGNPGLRKSARAQCSPWSAQRNWAGSKSGQEPHALQKRLSLMDSAGLHVVSHVAINRSKLYGSASIPCHGSCSCDDSESQALLRHGYKLAPQSKKRSFTMVRARFASVSGLDRVPAVWTW